MLLNEGYNTPLQNMADTPPISLAHLQALMGPLGLYQHARYTTARLEEGYCTDDNARAVHLLAELRAHRQYDGSQNEIEALFRQCWQFVCEAQTSKGLFRNFRSNDGTWLDERGSEDTQARVARALAAVITHDLYPARRRRAVRMLLSLLPHLGQLRHVRSQAESIIALEKVRSLHRTANIDQTMRQVFTHIWTTWQHTSSASWPWPEAQLTYASAQLPHGLLVGARTVHLLSGTIATALHNSAQFLIQTTITKTMFAPIGNHTWYPQHGKKATYDQQPVEAYTMLDFLLAYQPFANKPLSSSLIVAPYLWFFGHNTKRVSIAAPDRGTCYDGVTEDGVNLNCGAESLLAYLHSELLMSRASPEIRKHAHEKRMILERQTVSAISPT